MPKTSGASAPDVRIRSAVPYDFGETRVATLALLTLMALPGSRSGGVVMAKFSGHAATFRSSPTVFADTPIPGSTSTRIRSGQPPRSVWSAATFFALYRIWASSLPGPTGRRTPPTTLRPKADPASFKAILAHSASKMMANAPPQMNFVRSIRHANAAKSLTWRHPWSRGRTIGLAWRRTSPCKVDVVALGQLVTEALGVEDAARHREDKAPAPRRGPAARGSRKASSCAAPQ